MNEPIPEPKPIDAEPIAFSNGVRLTIRQWLGLGVFAVAFVLIAPTLWERYEAFPMEPDYRIPHDLSNDYWLYARYAEIAAQDYDGVIIGDSVVWGEYVTPDGTLSHYLNKELGPNRFANLGLGGAHQLALSGLVEHYAAAITNKFVLLQCNPLWMSSARSDLRDDSKEEFNHPRLIPQFRPRVPRYREEISTRLGVLVEEHFPFNQWTNHLQQAYYDRGSIPAWTVQHPYEDPVAPLLRRLPPLDREPRKEQLPWHNNSKKKIEINFEWYENEFNSLQWQAFQETVHTLRERGNRVFVLVGPLNEHMLAKESLMRYQKVKGWIKDWLQKEQIAHAVPEVLPSDQYGDMSHPLAVGYETLAKTLAAEPFFER